MTQLSIHEKLTPQPEADEALFDDELLDAQLRYLLETDARGITAARRNEQHNTEPAVPEHDNQLDRFVWRLALYAAEVVFVGRPIAQLGQSLTPAAAAALRRQQLIHQQSPFGMRPPRFHSGSLRPASRAVRWQKRDKVAHCVVSFRAGARVFGVAIRLERGTRSWRAASVTVL